MSDRKPAAPLVMLVEDDAAVATALGEVLQTAGYRVAAADSGLAARAALERSRPDLILLDLMLPDTDGLVLCSALKAATDARLIILSARQEQVDRVLSLKLGADDFISKPFDLDELLARVEAVLRRAGRSNGPHHPRPAHPGELRVGELVVAPTRGLVSLGGQPIHLTPTEYRLLVALASHPDQVLSRDTLGQLAWGYQELGNGHLIDVHIGRLRLKLSGGPSPAPPIVTVRRRGYKLASGAPTQLRVPAA